MVLVLQPYEHLRSLTRLTLLGAMACLLLPRPASAQSSIRDVLSHLVINRSIPTGDFVRDAEAAAATSTTISRFLSVELATLPIPFSSSGFVYEFDPSLGAVRRVTENFGPFFTERALTAGRGMASLIVSYRSITFDDIDGRTLQDGTLVSTASILRGEAEPFDVETVSLRIHLDTVTIAGSVGLTDRLEISTAVPIVTLTLRGERVDTYRGSRFVQAAGSGSATGVGDIVARAKYNMLRGDDGALSVAADVILPTGREEQLQGAGEASVRPRLLASFERSRVTLHGDVAYAFAGLADEFDYSGAATLAVTPRLTLVGEIIGRRLNALGRLVETTEPHPRLAGVDTIRLTSVERTTNRLLAVAGLKWNLAQTWVLSGSLAKPLTSVGLNARWVPSVSLDYSFGR